MVSRLRAQGIKVFVYLDDVFICGESREAVVKDAVVIRNLLELLGFVINEDKSVEAPSQLMDFVGFAIDSVIMSISLPIKKRLLITGLCERLLSRPQVSVRDLASILGLLSLSSLAVDFAQSHYRHVQRQYNTELTRGGETCRLNWFDGRGSRGFKLVGCKPTPF